MLTFFISDLDSGRDPRCVTEVFQAEELRRAEHANSMEEAS